MKRLLAILAALALGLPPLPALAQFQGPAAPYIDNALTSGASGSGMTRNAGNADAPTAQYNLGQLRSITPQQYGAAGDGTTDDTAAVQAWLTALATGQYIGHCSGKFRLTASVNGYTTIGYHMAGAAGLSGNLTGTCNFYVDYNDWTSAAIDLTNPSTPSTRGAGSEWDHFIITYHSTLTAPPIGFRHRYVSGDSLHDFQILQYTANRGTCLSLSSAWNVYTLDNVQIWGCGQSFSQHLVPATTTFSIASGGTTLTTNEAFFAASDVGLTVACYPSAGQYNEAFTITAFTSDTQVTVTGSSAAGAATQTFTNAQCAVSTTTVTATLGSPITTTSAASFSSSDVGRAVYIVTGAAANGSARGTFRSTIVTVVGTTVTLADNAPRNCSGCWLVVSPPVEIYSDGGVLTNAININRLAVEQSASTELVISNAVNLHLSQVKLHAWNNENGLYGQSNNQTTQFNALLSTTDAVWSVGEIEGSPVDGRVIINGVTSGNSFSGFGGIATQGFAQLAALTNMAGSSFSVSAIANAGGCGSTWPAAAAISDGTSTAGWAYVGPVSCYNQTSSKVAIQGTSTNDAACTGCVGQTIRAVAGGTSATITVTIASPGVVTWTAHGFSTTTPTVVNFTTTGALPTGLVAGTNYWTIPSTVTTNTFQLATSIANALAGTAINTSGSQSGVHTGINSGVLSSGSAVSILGFSVPAGDWDCSGGVRFIPAGGTTQTINAVGINSTVNNIGAADTLNGTQKTNFSSAAGVGVQLSVGHAWRPLAAAQTNYLAALATFAVSTETAAGEMFCRRMR